jgi:hypothetical protein
VLVIALESLGAGDGMSWRGRRHDDDELEGPRGKSAEDLFDAVFAAIHDGEQTAVGVDCPLTAPLSGRADDEDTLLAIADQEALLPSRAQLRLLLDQLGTWRPWTAVTTSPERWLATRSVLAWEMPPGTPADVAISNFFADLRKPRTVPDPAEPVVNLAVAAALRAGLVVERAELSRPALTIGAG